MAKQTGNQTAKGNAPNTGSPGPTPAPTKKYVQPNTQQRTFTPNYGTSGDPNMSSVEPGHTVTSPLADELKRINAQGDDGDHLQDIIQHGTARRDSDPELTAPQTRKVDATGYPSAHGMKSRQSADGSPGGVVPTAVGAPASALPSRSK